MRGKEKLSWAKSAMQEQARVSGVHQSPFHLARVACNLMKGKGEWKGTRPFPVTAPPTHQKAPTQMHIYTQYDLHK